MEQYDDEKFVAGISGQAELVVFDRGKPDLVHTFGCLEGSQQNLSLQLLPMFDPMTFPFAFVLSQTQLYLADLRRLQSFVLAPWIFKGAPHNRN